MERKDSLWQGMVLMLVLLMTMGIYLFLGALLLRLRNPTPADQGPLAAVSPDAGLVQVLEPAAGSAVRRGTELVVQAAVLQSGFLHADLVVDGYSAGVRINLEPGAAPWLIEWQLETDIEGSHTLVVRAVDEENGWTASAPVTITVVPRGRLFFASNREGAYAVYAMATDGGGVQRLTGGPGAARQPAWLSLGEPGEGQGGASWLAYVAETADGGSVIRRQDGEGRETDLVAGRDPDWLPAMPAGSEGAEGRAPAWLAYTGSADGLSQVFVLEVPGGVPRAVTGASEATAYAGQPAWRPPGEGAAGDGAAGVLAYVAEQERNSDIWLVSSGGGAAERLTDDPAMDWAPAWSPDGTRLAFVSDRGGSHQVYVMRADGTEVRALTDLSQGTESPSWSPDGFWLAVVGYTGDGAGIDRREIYLVRADGRGLVRLTHDAFDDTDVAWAWEP